VESWERIKVRVGANTLRDGAQQIQSRLQTSLIAGGAKEAEEKDWVNLSS